MDKQIIALVVTALFSGGAISAFITQYFTSKREAKAAVARGKNDDGDLSIKAFNSILNGYDKILRELRIELDNEKNKTGEMAKTLIEHASKLKEVMQSDSNCKEQLETAMNKIDSYKQQLEKK